MAQGGNSDRNASLDEQKERAAGRQKNPARNAPHGDDLEADTKGKTKGAFGESKPVQGDQAGAKERL